MAAEWWNCAEMIVARHKTANPNKSRHRSRSAFVSVVDGQFSHAWGFPNRNDRVSLPAFPRVLQKMTHWNTEPARRNSCRDSCRNLCSGSRTREISCNASYQIGSSYISSSVVVDALDHSSRRPKPTLSHTGISLDRVN